MLAIDAGRHHHSLARLPQFCLRADGAERQIRRAGILVRRLRVLLVHVIGAREFPMRRPGLEFLAVGQKHRRSQRHVCGLRIQRRQCEHDRGQISSISDARVAIPFPVTWFNVWLSQFDEMEAVPHVQQRLQPFPTRGFPACAWGGEKSGVFHLVMLFISVPQVTHCTGTVDVLTAKRLYPEAQSTPGTTA